MHSTGGGTGGGLGTAILEAIRACYPSNFALSVAVLPHLGGEGPLQHYNTILCAHALHQSSDAVLLLSNDELLASSGAARPVITAMNKTACLRVAALLAPAPGTCRSNLAEVHKNVSAKNIVWADMLATCGKRSRRRYVCQQACLRSVSRYL